MPRLLSRLVFTTTMLILLGFNSFVFAAIKKPLPLKDVLEQEQIIVVAEVEKTALVRRSARLPRVHGRFGAERRKEVHAKDVKVLPHLRVLSGLVDGYVSPVLILQAFGIALVLGLIGGLLPAYHAARMLPTAALRHE